MNIFDGLTLLGGLALFLFGMNIMGSSLEKRAGHKLKALLGSMTASPFGGFLLGIGVTALMQSSSVTTVMVVGFVNSGLMTLRQSVGIIMGANLGAAVTPWLLSLSGVSGAGFLLQLLKPSSFTPVLALIGVVLHNFMKDSRRRDTGMVLLGFSILMYGMEIMSGAVAGLRTDPSFTRIMTLFAHPLVGVLAGAAITAVIQSSSASIGILQALAATGGITYSVAIPIIMGQNIGTCISALLSSLGASKNARRAALIHLLFNVASAAVCLPLYLLAYRLLGLSFGEHAVNAFSIAMVNTVYKLASVALLAPVSRFFEPIACLLVRDSAEKDEVELLDERLLTSPSVAISRCRTVAIAMADLAIKGVLTAMNELDTYDPKAAQEIEDWENKVDYYEDKLGSYLVKLSSRSLTPADSAEASKLLRLISDFERISDHSVNILRSAQERIDKQLDFSDEAKKELMTVNAAVTEVLSLGMKAFAENDLGAAARVEPLNQTIGRLCSEVRAKHAARLQSGKCTIEMGFILTDLLTNLARISGHTSNIAGCVLEMTHAGMDLHEYLHAVRHGGGSYEELYDSFCQKYLETI